MTPFQVQSDYPPAYCSLQTLPLQLPAGIVDSQAGMCLYFCIDIKKLACIYKCTCPINPNIIVSRLWSFLAEVAIRILLLITGAVQTLPSRRPHIVTMPGLTTGRVWGSRHAPLAEEEGREGMRRRKWAESSSRPTRREKSGRKNKRSEVNYCQVWFSCVMQIL